MVQLVFMRLPQFSEDPRAVGIKQLKMRPGAIDQGRNKRKQRVPLRKKEKFLENGMFNSLTLILCFNFCYVIVYLLINAAINCMLCNINKQKYIILSKYIFCNLTN